MSVRVPSAASLRASAPAGVSSPLDGLPGRLLAGRAASQAPFAALHSQRRTSSRASFIHATTWKGSIAHRALRHLRLTSDLIHLAPSAVTTSMPHLCLEWT